MLEHLKPRTHRNSLLSTFKGSGEVLYQLRFRARPLPLRHQLYGNIGYLSLRERQL